MKYRVIGLALISLFFVGCQKIDQVLSKNQWDKNTQYQLTPTPCPQDGFICPDGVTIVRRNHGSCKFEVSDCPLPKWESSPNWLTHKSTTLKNIRFDYPPNWTVSELYTDTGLPYLIIAPQQDANQEQHQKTPEIILWTDIDSPFSTSGSLCANIQCVELDPVNIATADRWLATPIIYAHHPTESSLDYFRFMIPLTDGQARLYATLTDMNQMSEIQQIIQSIQFSPTPD